MMNEELRMMNVADPKLRNIAIMEMSNSSLRFPLSISLNAFPDSESSDFSDQRKWQGLF